MSVSREHFPVGSAVLFALAGLFVAAAVYNTVRIWDPAYFAITGRPFNVSLTPANTTYKPPVLPHFSSTGSVSLGTISQGGTEAITFSSAVDRATKGYVDVWVTSPANKQVFRSPGTTLEDFTAGKTTADHYNFTLPSSLPPGVYKVSGIVTSPDGDTDYLVKINFAEFTVS
jgi:hypothetical protein